MINLKNKFSLFCFSLLCIVDLNAQEKVIDRVVAVVGGNIVLQSELETQYQQLVSSQL